MVDDPENLVEDSPDFVPTKCYCGHQKARHSDAGHQYCRECGTCGGFSPAVAYRGVREGK